MKQTVLLMCLLFSTMGAFKANAQPPGKLMCGPVTFTAIRDQADLGLSAYHQQMMTISFYENGADTAFVQIQDISSGEIQMIPMKRRVIIRDWDVISFMGDADAMGLTFFFINVRTKRINAGDGCNDAFIQIVTDQTVTNDSKTFRHHIFSDNRQHKDDDWIHTNISFHIAEFDPSGNFDCLTPLSKDSQQYIDSYNSMVDYVNSICSTSKFYKCNN